MEIKNRFDIGDKAYWYDEGLISSFEIKAIAIMDKVVYYSDDINEEFMSEKDVYKTAKDCWEDYNWEEEPDYDKINFKPILCYGFIT